MEIFELGFIGQVGERRQADSVDGSNGSLGVSSRIQMDGLIKHYCVCCDLAHMRACW